MTCVHTLLAVLRYAVRLAGSNEIIILEEGARRKPEKKDRHPGVIALYISPTILATTPSLYQSAKELHNARNRPRTALDDAHPDRT